MKTNIKMRVMPEQSKKVQEICFENGIAWRINKKKFSHLDAPYLGIEEEAIFYRSTKSEYNITNLEEIDADLFIKTNGTCEETFKDKADEYFKEACQYYKKVEDSISNLIIVELQNKLKKKNEILKKARIKRKNQREELHKLNLKLQKCISLEEHHLKMKTVLNEKHYLEVENKSLKDSSKISCNMIHQQRDTIVSLRDEVIIKVDNMRNAKNKEIEKLKAIIEYLESKVK